MMFSIANNDLVATFSSLGAELTSLKSPQTDVEYIWQGNPDYWGRHAPVLFPIVGRLKNDHYHYQDKTYSMSQHGFARDLEFEVVLEEKELLTFSLKSSPETKESYPFEFELLISYELIEKSLSVTYEVRNQGHSKMFFSIGGHPAFNVPPNKEGTFADYYLHFNPQKSRKLIPLEGPYADLSKTTIGQTNTNLKLSREMFQNDALIFETRGAQSISICSEKSAEIITLTSDNMPFVGIWSPYPKEAPFVCLEPWWGLADTTDANGQLDEKFAINNLAPNEIFSASYQIKIN